VVIRIVVRQTDASASLQPVNRTGTYGALGSQHPHRLAEQLKPERLSQSCLRTLSVIMSHGGHALAAISVDPLEVRKAEIIAHATVALDGQKNAMQWLQRANPNLADRPPLEVLTHGRPEEQQLVDELLYALEFGIHT
jgi:hypothetical protein